MKKSSNLLAFGLAVSLVTTSAFGVGIQPGNLVVIKVGTGAAALGTTATAITVEEYTTAGGVVQTIPVASAGSTALTLIGNSTTEGILNRSPDGTRFVFGGYRTDAGTAAPSGSGIVRTLGVLNIDGTLDTANVGVTDTGAFRSATTIDGSSYYLGTSTGVKYVATPLASGSITTTLDTRNSRQVYLSGQELVASNGSTAVAAKVQSYGNLPITTTTPTTIVTAPLLNAVNGFVMLDLSDTINGNDTVYALDTVAGLILKYSYDGTAWTADGSIPSGGAANITGVVNGGVATLYTTNTTTMATVTDTSGFDAAMVGTLSTIATAPANTGFRGISIAPVPEPTMLAPLAMAAGLLLRRRRHA